MLYDEWCVSENAREMVSHLSYRDDTTSRERNWRLLACALARQDWGKLPPASRGAVQYAEQMTLNPRQVGHGVVPYVLQNALDAASLLYTSIIAARSCDKLRRVIHACMQYPSDLKPGDAFRCIFHCPPSPAPLPVIPEAVSLARAIYANRLEEDGSLDPLRMSILADCLEEAGVAEDVISHLRGKQPCPPEETVLASQVGYLCPACGSQGRWRRGVHFDHQMICRGTKDGECWTVWEPGKDTRLRCKLCQGKGWRALPRHYLGCWAVDLVLGL